MRSHVGLIIVVVWASLQLRKFPSQQVSKLEGSPEAYPLQQIIRSPVDHPEHAQKSFFESGSQVLLQNRLHYWVAQVEAYFSHLGDS